MDGRDALIQAHAMANVTLNGVSIAFDDIPPAGPAQRTVLLLHGFASNRNEGWKRTGWYSAFERRGIRTIALDQRGHGESVKSHDPADYGREHMAADALALMDHLGVDRCDVFGYSMGTRTAMQVALAQITIRQNEVVKRLAGWGAILAVPTMVFSLYGMNFKVMPELAWEWGYPVVLVVIGLGCGVLYRRLRKVGWL